MHVDRLKMAYVRAPSPTKFFADGVITNQQDAQDNQSGHESRSTDIDSSNGVNSFFDVDTDIDSVNDRANQFSESTRGDTNSAYSEECQVEQVRNIPQSRTRRKPVRFRDIDHVDPNHLFGSSVSSDENGHHQIKRVTAQKYTSRGTEYLVHLVGEPAQNALWIHFHNLNAKAQRFHMFSFCFVCILCLHRRGAECIHF